jgi:hypothetical protein
VTDKSETTNQAPRPDSLERQPESSPAKNGVFIRRAKGMPFPEFKEFCIKRFREAGIITEDPQDEPKSDKS